MGVCRKINSLGTPEEKNKVCVNPMSDLNVKHFPGQTFKLKGVAQW